jgi:hypothetical protein
VTVLWGEAGDAAGIGGVEPGSEEEVVSSQLGYKTEPNRGEKGTVQFCCAT